MGLQNFLIGRLMENSAIGKKIQSASDVSEKGRYALDATEKNPNIEDSMAEKIANLENETKKINNSVKRIISLPNGASTGDAQIEDAKVGIEGESYDTLGDAIREQIQTYRDVDVSNNLPKNKAKIWVNTADNDDAEEDILLPQVDDTHITDDNTWSSEKINNELEDIRGSIKTGNVGDESLDLSKFKNVTDDLNYSQYDVTVESTSYGSGCIVANVTPDKEVSSVTLSFDFVCNMDIEKLYISIADINGEDVMITEKSTSVSQTIEFTPRDTSFSVMIFVKSNAYPSNYTIKNLVLSCGDTNDSFPEFIIYSAYCSGHISKYFKEYKGLATREYVIGVLTNKSLDGKRWIAIGDSITSSDTLGTGVKNYVDYVSEKTGVKVYNKGVSGSGYWRGTSTREAFYQRVNQFTESADIITIFGSLNDLGTENGIDGSTMIGDYKDTGTNSICGCINECIDRVIAKYPRAIIGVISPTPSSSSRENEKVETYVTKLKEIAEYRSIPYLDLYHGSNLRPWDATFRESFYKSRSDGYNPNSNGHKRISNLISDFLVKITD